jgi:tetratricopeptide (TPR) repeat protein
MSRNLAADLELLRQIQALAQQGKIPEAAQLADKALAEGFEHPLLLNVKATVLENQGRLTEALVLLEKAVRLSPQNIPARNALGMLLQRLDRPLESLVHIDEVIRLDNQLGFAHANRGNALISLGKLGAARDAHQQAVALDPQNFVSWSALASIALQSASYSDATTYAERALQLAPGYPEATINLACAELGTHNFTRAEQLLNSVLNDKRVGNHDRARAYKELGNALDARAKYEDAFEAYRKGNDILAGLYTNLPGAAHFIDYITAINGAFLARAAGFKKNPSLPKYAESVNEHIFLLGFPRSGTTLLEVVLDGHPDVVSLEEYELLTDAVLRYLSDPQDLKDLAQASEDELNQYRKQYWDAVKATGINYENKVFIDKFPLNTLKLPLIARLFPHAKIIFARRDPRDVILSCYRRRFKMNPAMVQFLNLENTAKFYAATMRLATTCKPILGLEWMTVAHEDLVTQFKHTVTELSQFMGLEWNDAMSAFASRVGEREHATPSTAQLRKGLDQSHLNQWVNYASALAPIMHLIEPWIGRQS